MKTIHSLMTEYEDYLRNERRYAESTISAYMSDLRRLGSEITKDVAEITLNDLRDYQRLLGQQGKKLTTVERKFAGFSTHWKWLAMQGYASNNIVEFVRLPRRKRKLPRWLSEAELVRFVTTPVKIRYRLGEQERLREETAWKMLAWLGLRRSEPLKLRICDVYLNEGRVTIRSSKGDRDRILPLPDALRPLLQRLIGERSPQEYVFPGTARNGQWGLQSFMDAFYSHLKNCGLDGKGITPHTLRHTFATYLSRQGVRAEVIQELLGHADLKTTRVYLHTTHADLQRGLDRYILNSLDLTGGTSDRDNGSSGDETSTS